MKELEHLINLINSNPADIKAEALIADLLQDGFSESDYMVLLNSAFRMRYCKDILGDLSFAGS